MPKSASETSAQDPPKHRFTTPRRLSAFRASAFYFINFNWVRASSTANCAVDNSAIMRGN